MNCWCTYCRTSCLSCMHTGGTSLQHLYFTCGLYTNYTTFAFYSITIYQEKEWLKICGPSREHFSGMSFTGCMTELHMWDITVHIYRYVKETYVMEACCPIHVSVVKMCSQLYIASCKDVFPGCMMYLGLFIWDRSFVLHIHVEYVTEADRMSFRPAEFLNQG